MTTDPKIKERLKKLYALALGGVDGEKEQAKALLDKLSKKYNLTVEDLDNEEICKYEIEYHGEEQRKLLIQTTYKVTNRRDAIHSLYYCGSGRKCKTKMSVDCTAAQKIEIEFLLDFYTRIWEKEKKALLRAFVQKHEIFGSLKEGEKGDELPDEELQKMHALMKGLSDETPQKQIESGTA